MHIGQYMSTNKLDLAICSVRRVSHDCSHRSSSPATVAPLHESSEPFFSIILCAMHPIRGSARDLVSRAYEFAWSEIPLHANSYAHETRSARPPVLPRGTLAFAWVRSSSASSSPAATASLPGSAQPPPAPVLLLLHVGGAWGRPLSD